MLTSLQWKREVRRMFSLLCYPGIIARVTGIVKDYLPAGGKYLGME